jgi:hypothetical protein
MLPTPAVIQYGTSSIANPLGELQAMKITSCYSHTPYGVPPPERLPSEATCPRTNTHRPQHSLPTRFRPTLGLFSFILCTQLASAQTVFLDFNTANPHGDGSEAFPFKTLEDALEDVEQDIAEPNVIKILPGATNETIRIDPLQDVHLERHGAYGGVLVGAVGHLLTVLINGGGSVTPDSGAYDPGSLVLEAFPETDWSFLRWDGDLAGTTNPYTIAFSADTLAFARFSPTLLADLLLFNVSANDATGVRGDIVTVSWSVENYGGVSTSTTWDDGVFLSIDSLWDEDDKLLGDKPGSSPLASTATYQESLQVTIPDVAPGKYWLLVKADHEATVVEGVETVEDNTAVAGELLVLDPELNNE